MEKYIRWSDTECVEMTNYEYQVGEVITVNSVDTYKCVDKEEVDGKLIHHFKKGILTYSY